MAQIDGGNGSRWKISFNAATISALSAAMGAILYGAGFVSGYLSYSRNMVELLERTTKIEERLHSLDIKAADIQGDVKLVDQKVGQLQLLAVPKR